MNFQLEEILTVIDHVKAADLALFEYQDQGARIKIRGRKEKYRKKDGISLYIDEALAAQRCDGTYEGFKGDRAQEYGETGDGYWKDTAQEMSHESGASQHSNEMQKQGADGADINTISEKAWVSYSGKRQSVQKEESLPEVEERREADAQTSNGRTANPSANLYTQESPMVGTFYTASSEDAEPFVKVGDTVKQGQTIGIIEAMKLMNEVSADCGGVVEAILAENEQMVEYGQPLIRICRERSSRWN